MGVVGNKNPKDVSELGDDDCKVIFEALDADVSVLARVNRSSLSEAAVDESLVVEAIEGLPLMDPLVVLLNNRRFVCGVTSSL